MKKLYAFFNKKIGGMNSVMALSLAALFMAREGFCFFIFHQPKLPDALKDTE